MPRQSAVSENALFLSPEAPYPLAGGGALRSASLLEYLSRRYTVDAVFFAHSGSPAPAAALPDGTVRRSVAIPLPRHSRDTAARAWRNGKRLLLNRPPLFDRFAGRQEQVAGFVAGQRYDVAVIEHFWCAPYLETLRSSTRTIVLDLHNVESVWHSSLAAVSGPASGLAHRRFAHAYQRLESEWLPRFDAVLVTSEIDRQRVSHLNRQVCIYPNAIQGVGGLERMEDNAIAFSGNLEFEPNRAAIAFFASRVWPILRERFPALRWRIIGKNPNAVAELVRRDPSIEMTGPVDDAIGCLSRAKVAVVPILSGSGTRIKILEAWAAGTPVVSTTAGAEGLLAQDGEHLLLADDPATFAEKVSRLLRDGVLRAQLGQAGRTLCRERYTWKAAWTQLDNSDLFVAQPSP